MSSEEKIVNTRGRESRISGGLLYSEKVYAGRRGAFLNSKIMEEKRKSNQYEIQNVYDYI